MSQADIQVVTVGTQGPAGAGIGTHETTTSSWTHVRAGASSSKPASPATPTIWYETDNARFMYWDGDSWEQLATYHERTANPKMHVTAGTTAQRPSTPLTGQLYYDTTLARYVQYSGSAWVNVTRVYSAATFGALPSSNIDEGSFGWTTGSDTPYIYDGAAWREMRRFGVAPACRATRINDLACSNSSPTDIVFGTLDFETSSGMVNTSTGVVTVPWSGLYQVNVGARFASTSGGQRQLRLNKNGSNYAISYLPGNASNQGSNALSVTVKMSANDTFKALAFQDSGGSLNVIGDANTCYIEVTYLGPWA